MTKTLTEQWREGTLESGHYYIQWSFDCDPRPRNMIDFFDKEYSDGGEFMLQQHKYIDEVLAPVPRYDEYKRLQEQLADASKTIDYYDKKDFHYTLADGTVMGAEPAHKYKIKWGVK